MIYHAFFKNDSSIYSHDISDITQQPDIDYIVKIDYNSGGFPKYTIVDSSGLVSLLKVGEFELRDVGYISYNSVIRKYPVTITICETRLNHLFQESLYAVNDVSIFPKFIIPFLKQLNECGSYKSYKQSLEIIKLKERIEELNEELNNCMQMNNKIAK